MPGGLTLGFAMHLFFLLQQAFNLTVALSFFMSNVKKQNYYE